MLRFSLVLIVITALVGPQVSHGASRLTNGTLYHFIHPTFLFARTETKELAGYIEYLPILSNDFASVKQAQQGLFGHDGPESGIKRIESLATSVAGLKQGTSGVNFDIISYERERNQIKKYFEDEPRHRNQTTWDGCHRTVTPRALDAWQDTDGSAIALAIEQSGHMCVMLLTDLVHGSLLSNHMCKGSVYYTNLYFTKYRTAAMWASKLRGRVATIGLVDEAGFVYNMTYDADKNYWTKPDVYSLSAINLEPKDSGFQFGEPFANQRALESLKQSSPNALENLQLHYRHSFVEAIYLYNGTLCWSTGSRPGKPSFFAPGHQQAQLPPGNSNEDSLLISAMEMYTYNGVPHYQSMAVIMGPDMISRGFQYSFCKFLGKWQCEYPESMKSKTLVPIDLVYIPGCNRVVAFYQHMYSLHHPEAVMKREPGINPRKHFDLSNTTLISWMNFPLNAVLYANERLYLFSSGNELRVSKKLSDLSDGKCSLEWVEIEASIAQSQLLLGFNSTLNRQSPSDLLPLYVGGTSMSETGEWQPPLNQTIRFDAELALPAGPYVEPAPVPGPSPTTVAPKPSPSGNSTSVIIVIVIVIVIIGIVCGSIYYFCCGGPEDAPIRGPKSALRKFKTSAGATKIQPVEPVPSNQGSALKPVATLRSALSSASKLGSQSGGKVSKSALALKVAKSSIARKSTKGKSSPGPVRSPKSKSAKSPGPSSPKKSSPADGATIASAKSKRSLSTSRSPRQSPS